jgi:hypothetical protein
VRYLDLIKKNEAIGLVIEGEKDAASSGAKENNKKIKSQT